MTAFQDNSPSANDILNEQEIESLLNNKLMHPEINVYTQTGSTNDDARKAAHSGAHEGYIVIAEHQTAGKGRRGRKFFSPGNTGLYLSIVLRPANIPAEHATSITTMAAVAACEAIEAISPNKAQIKWVNDIFINGRKASGILTEASINPKTSCLDFAILGIGFNVYPPHEGFPEELQSLATTVFQEPQSNGRNRLAAEFINRFMTYYHAENMEDYVSKYRERCFVIGQEVTVHTPTNKKEALVLDINNECNLIVRYSNGETETLSSGEISIQMK